jgi:hypothetical protein
LSVPNLVESRLLTLKPRNPAAEEQLQQTGDFFGTPMFRLQPDLGLGREINGRQWVLHHDSPNRNRMETQLLLDRNSELAGVNRLWRMRRRACDQPNGNSRAHGGNNRRDRNWFLPAHRTRPLKIPVVRQAGPAIFPIDEAKDQGHGTNSVVDCMKRIAALCFMPISSGGEIGVVGPQSGFVDVRESDF